MHARAERGAGAARRGGDREDGAAGVRRRSAPKAAGLLRAVGVESEMELRVRRAAPVVCAAARPARAAAGAPARCARDRVRLELGRPPDRFLVGLAVLSLLSDGGRGAAASLPDRRCAVARSSRRHRCSRSWRGACWRSRSRSCSRSASRASSTSWPGCRSCGSKGSADADARALLASVISGPLDERVRERIVAETHGNPLALLELPRGLSPAELAGGFGLPDALPLPSRIEESFRQRVERSPPRRQRLLLVGRGRADRRPDAVVAGGRAARHRRRGGGACRSRGPARRSAPG